MRKRLTGWVAISGFVVLVCTPTSTLGQSCCRAIDDPLWRTEALADQVRLHSRHFEDLFGAPQYVVVLEIEAGAAGKIVSFDAASRHGAHRLTVPEYAGKGCPLAVVNGGFAHGGAGSNNSGIVRIEGEVLPYLAEEPEELMFVGAYAAGIDTAGVWQFRRRGGDRWSDDWPGMAYALAGGHALIVSGQIDSTIAHMVWRSEREVRHAGSRHPRTALCTTGHDSLLLLVADGRHAEAEGLTLPELATFMASLGCLDAINYDGGGSSTVWVRDRGVLNHPSDNGRFDADGARLVKTFIVVRADENCVP
jgi:exopolysaccharide biosynthesis protein